MQSGFWSRSCSLLAQEAPHQLHVRFVSSTYSLGSTSIHAGEQLQARDTSRDSNSAYWAQPLQHNLGTPAELWHSDRMSSMFPQANPASGGSERQLPDIMLPCQENAAALVCSSAGCWMCCMLEDAIGKRQTVQPQQASGCTWLPVHPRQRACPEYICHAGLRPLPAAASCPVIPGGIKQ